MTFRLVYAESVLEKLAYYVRKQTINGGCVTWEVNINVSKFWHFNIQYELDSSIERIKIVHQNRRGHVIIFENGKIVKHTGLRRFDMLFAALNEDLISMLKNGKNFKITRKKMNERFLTKTPYFWSKIEYYLQKKEDQRLLFDTLGDEKYKTREERIEKAIQCYAKEKKEFVEDTKKKSLV